MTTKFRPATIIFSLLMLTLFGSIPATLLYRQIIQKPMTAPVVIISVTTAFALLFFAGLIAIIWLTVRVQVDTITRQITFYHPLRRRSSVYDFKKIVGFRYKYLSGKINYKALKFRTEDMKTFSVSDFETRNLRGLEKIALDNFELRADKSFRSLTREETYSEIMMSKYFDLEQAKEIRAHFIMLVVLLFLLAGLILYQSTKSGGQPSATGWLIMLFSMSSAFLILTKLPRLKNKIALLKQSFEETKDK